MNGSISRLLGIALVLLGLASTTVSEKDTRVEFTWRCFRVSLGVKVTEGVIRFRQRLSMPSAGPGDKSCLNFRESS
jgi:hypothetical protein